MSLPQRLPLELMQTQWASSINPVIENPLNLANILTNVKLINGTNVINHLLGRQMQGWFLVDKQDFGDVKRTAPFNSLTLTLTTNAAMTVNIGVF